MKKIYLCPATDVYKINYSNVIMMSPGEAGDKVNPVNWDSNPGVIDPGEIVDDEDNARVNNGGNVWDNAW